RSPSRARTARPRRRGGGSGSAARSEVAAVARIWATLSLVIGVFAAFVWSIDYVTLQGERTIYAAQCRGGSWVDDRCTGTLAAAERYKFRALKAKGEVVHWVAGSADPSGKLTECTIQDGRNWSCKANSGSPKSITVE